MTINEVSKKLNITQVTLRFYEKTGLIDPIRRDKSGYRNYQEEDLRRIEYKITLYNNGELDKYLEKDENKN